MTSFRIRPRFKIYSDKSAVEIEHAIQKQLDKQPERCVGRVISNHITIGIPHEEQHYWSPQLGLSLEEEDEKTLIRGLYGPAPNVWTLFVFLYATIGILSLFIVITGTSKLSLSKSANELWALPIFAAGAIFLYFLSQVGQKLGAEQTFKIHHFLEEAIEQEIHIV